MSRSLPFSAETLREYVSSDSGRRVVGIGAALLIEVLLVCLLLTLGMAKQPGSKESDLTVVNLEASDSSDDAAPEKSPEPAKQQRTSDERPVPQPTTAAQTPTPPAVEPAETLPVPAVLPSAFKLPPAGPAKAAPPAAAPKQAYGPANRGASGLGDTERVGTAPNGEPMYAAAWYREPRDDELAGYLSTASGPGWGLIACKTAPQYRVEDCVALGEYPDGSRIDRAVLAAAWQFRVRPPRIGGVPQVGSWVRIRIDYGMKRAGGG